MQLTSSITAVPFLHGNLDSARHIRAVCARDSFDCIAVDLPHPFGPLLTDAVDRLPLISAVVARGVEDPVYYVPADPCDAAIEGIRQSRQGRIPWEPLGTGVLRRNEPLPPLPDPHVAVRLGFDAFASLCLRVIGMPGGDTPEDREARHVAWRLRGLELSHQRILALIHARRFAAAVKHFPREYSYNYTPPAEQSYRLSIDYINPDHLYFALGELPFITGRAERERQDVFGRPAALEEEIKELFRETRDQYGDEGREEVIDLSPVRIQAALTFLRNLTVMGKAIAPSLFDIIQAAKGVGGNSYALKVLRCARYYPYLPLEHDHTIGVGIDKMFFPEEHAVHDAVNLLRDTALVWRKLSIKPDPSEMRKKRYRYRWNPSGMCSHVPEDRRIEQFNAAVRTRALRAMREDLVKTEKFTASVKDGIDFRETLRNWHTGDIYVRELPPSRGAMDTVVIIFDGAHDDRYPHCATWYAEHDEESTLTFFATDPFADLIGPGVARSFYGGVSLLFPPRWVPNAFDVTKDMGLRSLTERITYGALRFSEQRNVGFVAASRPDVRLRSMAARMGGHLVWIPLGTFSNETLRRLRKFHVLNGKRVRSWAARFIGD